MKFKRTTRPSRRRADLRISRDSWMSLEALTLFPYQNPQGCHAARRTQNDVPWKAVAQDVSAALLQSVADADGVVDSDAVVDVAAAAAGDDDE